MKGDEQRALDAGCDGYVAKPIDVETLPALIARYVEGVAACRHEEDGVCRPEPLDLSRISGAWSRRTLLRGGLILALTAYAMKGDEEKARAAGCDGYVANLIDTRSLPALLARLCLQLSRGQHDSASTLRSSSSRTIRSRAR